MRVGFTGTRTGMTADQLVVLRNRLTPAKKGGMSDWTMFSEFHHGDCVGADEEAHDMMRVLISRNWPLRVDLVIHPPNDERYRAHCDLLMSEEEKRGGKLRVLPERGYLQRDRDIVRGVDMMIACPAGYDFRGNGGTNYTIRYALEIGRKMIIIWPDGSVSTDEEVMENA